MLSLLRSDGLRMQLIRRVALLLSLALLVAIAVGALVRTKQAERERDLDLRTAVSLAAERTGELSDHVRLAALSGATSSRTIDALTTVDPDATACVVDADTVRCGGVADSIPAADIERARDRITAAAAADDDAGSDTSSNAVTFDVYDGMVTVTATHHEMAVVLRAPVTTVDTTPGDEIQVWVAARTGSDSAVGQFVSADSQRQVVGTVDGAPELLVAATGPDDVSLPLDEQRFYAVSMVLGLVLLALAGFTVFLEQRTLHERAAVDALTRLPNRAEFERRASCHLGDGDDAACLLLFDLNGFKQVNDTHGHLVGDEVLRIVSGRLRTAVRDGDIVGRWGGDEFVVLMPGVESHEMGLSRAEQLSEAVSGRARIDSIGTSLRLKASVGVAIAPEHGHTLADLIESADMAMYRAKRNGQPMHLAHRPDRELIDSLS